MFKALAFVFDGPNGEVASHIKNIVECTVGLPQAPASWHSPGVSANFAAGAGTSGTAAATSASAQLPRRMDTRTSTSGESSAWAPETEEDENGGQKEGDTDSSQQGQANTVTAAAAADGDPSGYAKGGTSSLTSHRAEPSSFIDEVANKPAGTDSTVLGPQFGQPEFGMLGPSIGLQAAQNLRGVDTEHFDLTTPRSAEDTAQAGVQQVPDPVPQLPAQDVVKEVAKIIPSLPPEVVASTALPSTERGSAVVKPAPQAVEKRVEEPELQIVELEEEWSTAASKQSKRRKGKNKTAVSKQSKVFGKVPDPPMLVEACPDEQEPVDIEAASPADSSIKPVPEKAVSDGSDSEQVPATMAQARQTEVQQSPAGTMGEAIENILQQLKTGKLTQTEAIMATDQVMRTFGQMAEDDEEEDDASEGESEDDDD